MPGGDPYLSFFALYGRRNSIAMMVEGDSGAIFPVVFFDGEREINMGGVRIHPSLDYKIFQSGLGQTIGISPNQITVYLVDCKRPRSSMEVRRKIPVTAKVNFAAIAKEVDCFFLVVLKRTRRKRRPKMKQDVVEFGDYLPENKLPPLPENILLLRRNQPELQNPEISNRVSSHYNQIAPPEFSDYNERLQKLQIRQGRRMNSNAISAVNLELDSFARIEESFRVSSTNARSRPFCAECTNAWKKGISAGFHLCVFDAVTVGFRSKAGPIARPAA